jgi:LysM repeat protein
LHRNRKETLNGNRAVQSNPCYLHFVKQGETLSELSKLYNISIEEIKAEKPVLEEGLKVDQVLRIPKRPETEIAPNPGRKSCSQRLQPREREVYIGFKQKERSTASQSNSTSLLKTCSKPIRS